VHRKSLCLAIPLAILFVVASAVPCRSAVASAATIENLYAQNSDGDLVSYRIKDDGSLAPVGTLKVPPIHDPGSRDSPYALDLVVSPGTRFAYSPEWNKSNLVCFPISQENGALVESKGGCDAGAKLYIGQAAAPSGQLLYVNADGILRPYAIEPASGKLKPVEAPLPGTGPAGIGERPPALAAFGSRVYIVCRRCSNVHAIRFIRDGSKISARAINLVPTGSNPIAIVLDPAGQFAYVANAGDSTISEYYIDPASGAIRPNPKIQTAALHAQPIDMLVDPTGRYLYTIGYPEKSTAEWRDPYTTAPNGLIDQFRIRDDGTLESLGAPIRLPSGRSDFSRYGTMLIDPAGRFIYVTVAVPTGDKNGNVSPRRIEVLRIGPDGHLAPLGPPTLPILYNGGATVSWIGSPPAVSIARRNVTPLLALKAPLEGAFTRAGTLSAVQGSDLYPSLLRDGRVFFLERDPWSKTRAEIYDPAGGKATELGIIVPRNDAPIVAATLPDGNYLLQFWELDKLAAILNPETMMFRPNGHLRASCYRDAWILNDRRILFPLWSSLVGSVSAPCGGDIYDLSSGESSILPPALKQPFVQIFGKFADGNLLYRKGPVRYPYWDWRKMGPNARPGDLYQDVKQNDFQAISIFDPATGKSRPAGRMPDRLMTLQSVTLEDGAVFIVGDTDDSPTPTDASSNRAELYEPATEKFVELGRLLQKRDEFFALTPLKDGRVLISGGLYRSDAELFDPKTREFTEAGSLNDAFSGGRSLMLADGDVLFAGGDRSATDRPQTIEIYHPPPR